MRQKSFILLDRNGKEQHNVPRGNKSDFTLLQEFFNENRYADQIYFHSYDLRNLHVKKVVFQGCDFTKAKLQDAVFEDCIFEQCIFTDAQLENAEFLLCQFEHINFNWVDLNNVITNGCRYWFVTTDYALNNKTVNLEND
jgi:uncharacterized protein YjbI with pentapeptide repeats